MPRPLTGSSWQRGKRYYASVPAVRGATRRIEESFEEEEQRNDWRDAAVAALNNGRPVPDAALFRLRPATAAPCPDSEPPAAHQDRPRFEDLAHGWLEEHYGLLRNADAERERDVRILVENYLIPWFAGPVPSDAAAARKRLVAFVRWLAVEPEWDPQSGARAADDERLLTVTEAIAASGRSEATIRRALRAGALNGARRDADGRWRIPYAALVAVAPRPAQRNAVGRPYQRSILWAHGKILDWGRANGWDIAPFERGVNALTPDDSVARKKGDTQLRRPVSIAEAARLASHLHVVHQLALWLMRVLGLRISEAFGLHVGDIVDLGEFGVAFVRRQGGRPFLTRTRSGIHTSRSKKTLKTAAAYRVLVIPPTLMALLRVVVAAFHTDPVSGEVDLDARLVPWIVKDGSGQSAFRQALEPALRHEGLDVDTAGFELVSHGFRKSVATVLAWDDTLDDLAKRRYLGHKAGDDVFLRIYTLDHPTLAPLVKIARAVESDINNQVQTLMTPTEHRVAWGHDNPMRGRVVHVNAVLAESAWQVEPGGTNPWCDTLRVAAELGVAETTARRWMREQIVLSTSDTDEFGNPRRRARLSDVEAVREQLAHRILLRDLADELGVGYYRLWRALHRLGLVESNGDTPPRELVLTAEQAQALRVEFSRLTALFERSMRVSSAATRLGVAFSTAQKLARRGDLVIDPGTDTFGAQYVTKASVEALVARRSSPKPRVPNIGLLDVAVAKRITGLNQRQLSDLCVEGVLVRCDVGRRFHITKESLERWATNLGAEVVAHLGDPEGRLPPVALDPDIISSRQECAG